MEEKNYYSDNVVQVTSTRVLFPGTTYSMRNISSVKKHMLKASHTMDLLIIVLGVFVLLPGFCVEKGFMFIVIGIILIGLGIYLFMQKKNSFVVVLGTNAGEQQAYTDQNEERINNIIGAINNAIIEYK